MTANSLCDDCPHVVESWDETTDADGRTYEIPWPIPPLGHATRRCDG